MNEHTGQGQQSGDAGSTRSNRAAASTCAFVGGAGDVDESGRRARGSGGVGQDGGQALAAAALLVGGARLVEEEAAAHVLRHIRARGSRFVAVAGAVAARGAIAGLALVLLAVRRDRGVDRSAGGAAGAGGAREGAARQLSAAQRVTRSAVRQSQCPRTRLHTANTTKHNQAHDDAASHPANGLPRRRSERCAASPGRQ